MMQMHTTASMLTAAQHPMLRTTAIACMSCTQPIPRYCLLCRLEGKREAAAAKAFDAASQAKALVRSWKKPALTAGHSPLPVEMWGLVLEQLLTKESLWDLPAVAQELAGISLTCKDFYTAVVQQGWPKLSSLLSPKCPPSYSVREPHSWSATGHGQLPSNPELLVRDPDSLKVAELRDACKCYGLPWTGAPTSPQSCLTCLLCQLRSFGTGKEVDPDLTAALAKRPALADVQGAQ